MAWVAPIPVKRSPQAKKRPVRASDRFIPISMGCISGKKCNTAPLRMLIQLPPACEVPISRRGADFRRPIDASLLYYRRHRPQITGGGILNAPRGYRLLGCPRVAGGPRHHYDGNQSNAEPVFGGASIRRQGWRFDGQRVLRFRGRNLGLYHRPHDS